MQGIVRLMSRVVISDPAHPLAAALLARGGPWRVSTAWEGADVAIVLTDPDGQFGRRSYAEAHPVRVATELAARHNVSRLVVLSSATVYGAWPTNAVPLTEGAPARPVPGFDAAFYWAEGERLLDEWVGESAQRSGCALRAAPVISLAKNPVLRALWRADIRPVTDAAEWSAPPWQSLSVDDLVGALLVVAEADVSGPINAAPDGWVAGADVASFGGMGLGLAARVMAPAARALRATRATPPPVMAYVLYPWVVANDRLRALGWEPQNTNEEALVAARPETPVDRLFGRYRQELTLAAVATGVGAGLVGLATLARRARR